MPCGQVRVRVGKVGSGAVWVVGMLDNEAVISVALSDASVPQYSDKVTLHLCVSKFI